MLATGTANSIPKIPINWPPIRMARIMVRGWSATLLETINDDTKTLSNN